MKKTVNAVSNSETLLIIQNAVRLGFEFHDTQEMQDVRFAAEEYIKENLFKKKEKIYIKKCEKSGFFIARYEDKFGRILNSQFVPMEKSKINIEYDFNSCLGWEEFENVGEFINKYFFNIDINSIEKKIKDKKSFEKLKLLNASKKNLEGLKKYIKNEYLEKNIIGFSVEVQEYDNSNNVLDNAIYDKKKSFDLLEESYKNYQEELKNMFIFQSGGDYKTVSLYIIFENNQEELLDDEFTFFQDNPLFSRKNAK